MIRENIVCKDQALKALQMTPSPCLTCLKQPLTFLQNQKACVGQKGGSSLFPLVSC